MRIVPSVRVVDAFSMARAGSAMRRLGLGLMLSMVALPAAAQLKYVKTPITIENARLTPPGQTEAIPVTIPLSQPVSLAGAPNCVQTPSNLNVQLVDNVLSVSWDGRAEMQTTSANCDLEFHLNFDVVMSIPVVSLDPAAFVYLHASPGEAQFSALKFVRLELRELGMATSVEAPNGFDAGFGSARFEWTPPANAPTLRTESAVSVATMFPADTVRRPMRLSITAQGRQTWAGGSTAGAVSAQFEFRTRFPQPVPGPSGSLSLPLGVASLAALSMMRGGV